MKHAVSLLLALAAGAAFFSAEKAFPGAHLYLAVLALSTLTLGIAANLLRLRR